METNFPPSNELKLSANSAENSVRRIQATWRRLFKTQEKNQSAGGGCLPHPASESCLSDVSGTEEVKEMCLICYENVAENKIKKNLCGPDCPLTSCTACLKTHFESIVKQGYDGILKKMTCPGCISMTVPSDAWSPFVDASTLELFQRRAAILLSLQCSGCHSRKDLFIPETELPSNPEQHLKNTLKPLLENENAGDQEYRLALGRFVRGEDNEDAFFQQLRTRFFPGKFAAAEDPDAGPWAAAARPALLSVRDARARAVLHLRYLREHPKVTTGCCQATQCFRCRTGRWHAGQTCAEVAAASYQHSDLLTCASCGLQLVKGDGCSSVTCVCGNHFDWDQRCREVFADGFQERHGEDAPRLAALAHHRPEGFEAADASAARHWARAYPDRAQAAFAALWAELHGRHAAAAARAVLKVNTGVRDNTVWPEGVKELAKGYRRVHREQVRVASEEGRRAGCTAVEPTVARGLPPHALWAFRSVRLKLWPTSLGKVAPLSLFKEHQRNAGLGEDNMRSLKHARDAKAFQALCEAQIDIDCRNGQSYLATMSQDRFFAAREIEEKAAHAFLARRHYLKEIKAVAAFSNRHKDCPLLAAKSIVKHCKQHSKEEVAMAKTYLEAKRMALCRFFASEWEAQAHGAAAAPFITSALGLRDREQLGFYARQCLEAWEKLNQAQLDRVRELDERARSHTVQLFCAPVGGDATLAERHPALLPAALLGPGLFPGGLSPPTAGPARAPGRRRREKCDAAAFDALYGSVAVDQRGPATLPPAHAPLLAAWRRQWCGVAGARALRFLEKGYSARDRPELFAGLGGAALRWGDLARAQEVRPGALVALRHNRAAGPGTSESFYLADWPAPMPDGGGHMQRILGEVRPWHRHLFLTVEVDPSGATLLRRPEAAGGEGAAFLTRTADGGLAFRPQAPAGEETQGWRLEPADRSNSYRVAAWGDEALHLQFQPGRPLSRLGLVREAEAEETVRGMGLGVGGFGRGDSDVADQLFELEMLPFHPKIWHWRSAC